MVDNRPVLLLPVVTLGAAFTAYALALLAWRRQRPSWAIAGLLAGGLALRAYAAGDVYLHDWDERFHALVAKNLMAHPLRPTLYDDPLLPYDYRNWREAHVWLHKPPLALWLMALSMSAFGLSELALRLPSLLLSTAAVYATYRIGRSWKGPGVGLLAAFLHSVNAFLVLLAGGWVATDHVDTALVSFVGLAVAAAVGGGTTIRSFLALGVLSGLALLSKGLPGLLALPVALAWHWRKASMRVLLRGGGLALAGCLALALPWWLHTTAAFPAEAAWERFYDLRHFSEPLEGHGGGMLFHVERLPRIYGELVFIPLLWWVYRLVRGEREPAVLALSLWILLPYLVFSSAASKMPGYVMIAAPAVFLVQAAFCARLAGQGGTAGRRRLRLLLLGLILVLPVRIVLDGLRLFRDHDRRPAWADELKQLGRRLAGTRAVIFGSPRPVETMFYTSQAAYANVPDRATVESLQRRGYRVLLYEASALTANRQGWPGVEYLR